MQADRYLLNPWPLRFRGKMITLAREEHEPLEWRTVPDPNFCYMWHIWGPETVWYHGTRQDFTKFKALGVRRVGGGWGAQLGVHFTAHADVADQFAHGDHYRRRAKDVGRVVHARLRVKRPINYSLEADLYLDAARRVAAAWDLAPPPNEYSGGINWMLALGQRRGAAAKVFLRSLRADGYDAIVYENMVEGGTAVIVQPEQIEVLAQDPVPHVVPVVRAWLEGRRLPAKVRAQYHLDGGLLRAPVQFALAHWDADPRRLE